MKTTGETTQKVLGFLSQLDRLSDGVVVAVSGGPDSMALAHLLLGLRSRLAIGPLVIAHLNHRLRACESDADEAFVRQSFGSQTATAETSLRLQCDSRDVASMARSEHANLEALGRRVRYEWLVSVARREKIRYVATGHTASDQAETVLHRLLRGSGLKGLRGIPARRPLAPDVEVVRPLLRVTRAQVLSYLNEQGQIFREDSSNRNLQNTRNRIRHELLPYLATHFNPSIVKVLCQLSEQADVAFARRQAKASALLAEAELTPAGTTLVFNRQRLANSPRPLVREVFRLAWCRQGWPEQAMGFAEWDRLAAVAAGELVAADLPGGIRARAQERVVQVGPVS
jgi:tRNA(Ile)-lysidine synthase